MSAETAISEKYTYRLCVVSSVVNMRNSTGTSRMIASKVKIVVNIRHPFSHFCVEALVRTASDYFGKDAMKK